MVQKKKRGLAFPIIEVADLSRFNFATTVDDVVMWLEDIIDENGLYSIVFVWDEFSDYF